MAKVEGNNFRTSSGTAGDTATEAVGSNHSRHYLAVYSTSQSPTVLYVGIVNPTTGVPDTEIPLTGGCAWSPSVPPTNAITVRGDTGVPADYILHEG